MKRVWGAALVLAGLSAAQGCVAVGQAVPGGVPTPTLSVAPGLTTEGSTPADNATERSAAPTAAPQAGAVEEDPAASPDRVVSDLDATAVLDLIDLGLAATSNARFEFGSGEAITESTCAGVVTFDKGWTADFDVDCTLSGVDMVLKQFDGVRYLSSPFNMQQIAPGFPSDLEWLHLGEIDYESGIGLHYRFNQVDFGADATWLANFVQWVTTVEETFQDLAPGERAWTWHLDTQAMVGDIQDTIVEDYGFEGEPTPAPQTAESWVDVRMDADGRLTSVAVLGRDSADEPIKTSMTMSWSNFDRMTAPSAPNPAMVFVP